MASKPRLIDRVFRRQSVDLTQKPKEPEHLTRATASSTDLTSHASGSNPPAQRDRSTSAPPRIEGNAPQAQPTGRARSDSAPPRLEGNVSEPKRRSGVFTAIREFFFPPRLEGQDMSAIAGAINKQAGADEKILGSVNAAKDKMWPQVWQMNKLVRELENEKDPQRIKEQVKQLEKLEGAFRRDHAAYEKALQSLSQTHYQEEFQERKSDIATAASRVDTISEMVAKKKQENIDNLSMTKEEVNVKALLATARAADQQVYKHKDDAELALITGKRDDFRSNFSQAQSAQESLKGAVSKLEKALESESLQENKTLYAEVKKEVESLGASVRTFDRMISSLANEAAEKGQEYVAQFRTGPE